jgi:enoyl-CoA hydratase/carnithine racemase
LPTDPDKYVLYEKQDGIGWITLNRPEKLNAINYLMRAMLREALDDVAADETVRVAVIQGAGRAFSSGADLNGSEPPPDAPSYYDRRDIAHMFSECVWANPKPIIAAVHGYTLARGGDLAAACDITIAADDAQFGYPVLWQSPLTPKCLWPWTIGLKLTKELVYTGRLMDAHEAKQHDLVNRVVPRDRLTAEVTELAVALANGADKRPQKATINAIYEDHLGVRSAMNELMRPREAEETEFYGGDDPANVTFRRLTREEGLGAALAWREQRIRGQAGIDTPNGARASVVPG